MKRSGAHTCSLRQKVVPEEPKQGCTLFSPNLHFQSIQRLHTQMHVPAATDAKNTMPIVHHDAMQRMLQATQTGQLLCFVPAALVW